MQKSNIKFTCKLYGIKPEMMLAYIIISEIYLSNGQEVTITCGLDSHEGKVSLHNIGYALDFRTKHIVNPAIKINIIAECKAALPQYDVDIHDNGNPNEHLHVEFDPKNDDEFQARKTAWKATGGVNW